MQNTLIISQSQGFFNQRKKYFLSPDGTATLWETLTFPTPCFNPDHLEPLKDDAKLSNKCSITSDECEEVADNILSYKGRSRAKKRFFNAMMADYELDIMVTLTFSADKVNRTDYGEIIKKLSVWLDNRVRRKGLKYLLVPEYHKDGRSIHFHGFMNSSSLKLVDSGRKQKGRRVYNITDFDFGFTTAVKLDKHRECAAYYCYKYVTKETVKIGGRYVLQGGDIRKPVYVYDNVDFEQGEGETLTTGDGLVYKIATRG